MLQLFSYSLPGFSSSQPSGCHNTTPLGGESGHESGHESGRESGHESVPSGVYKDRESSKSPWKKLAITFVETVVTFTKGSTV